MAAKGTTFDNDFLKLLFTATAIANIADNAASAPLTALYVSLHTSDPTTAGNQTSGEIAYTGYARVTVARTAGGWTVTTNSVSPVSAVTFPQMTGGAGGTASYAAVGTASTGTGKLLWYGAISPTISVSNGVSPQLATTSTITET